MKIALYSTSSIPSIPVLEGYGGVEPFVGSLAEHYDNKNHEVHLFAPEGSYEPKHGKLHSFDVTILDERHREKAMFELFKNVDFTQYDIVHDNSHWHIPGVELVPDIGYLFTLHALQSHYENFKLNKYHYNGVTLSYDHAKFMQWMTPLTFRTIQDGVNLNHYPYKKEKGERLLWLSRIFPPKGAHRAIKIAEKAKIPIDIVGGSPIDTPGYLDEIKRLCRRSEYATFVGEVPHKEKIKYLQDAKAVILPLSCLSTMPDGRTNVWVEAACMIPLEAAACGTPTIVTPNGLTGEVISEGLNGFLALSDYDFLEKIKRLDEIESSMCRRRAEYFSFDKTAEKYLSLYRDVVDGTCW